MNEPTTLLDMIQWLHPFAKQVILLSVLVAIVSLIIFIAKKEKRLFSVWLLSQNIKLNLIVAGIAFFSKTMKFCEMAAAQTDFSRTGSMNLCFANFAEISTNPLTILFFTAYLFVLKFILSCPGEFKKQQNHRVHSIADSGKRCQ